MTKKYYRGAHVALFVFSVSDRDSFLAIESWKKKVVEICGDEIPMFLIMNKIDLPEDQTKVTDEEATNAAAGVRMSLYRTSVKDNIKIEEIFDHAAIEFFNKGMNRNGTVQIPDVKEVKKDVMEKKKNEIKELGKPDIPKEPSNSGFKIERRETSKKEKKKGCC